MSELPGRKAMMLFSDGLRIKSESSKVQELTGCFRYLEQVVDTANRSSVVIYTFDTKGLRSTGPAGHRYE